jgi:hypothetical protein
MKIKTNPIVTDNIGIYKEFLRHYSSILPDDKKLTKTEIDVLAAFWDVQGDGVEAMRFSPQIKKLIRDKFKFKHYANLENYLNSLKLKGFIEKNSLGLFYIQKKIDLKKPINNLVIEYEYRLQEDK